MLATIFICNNKIWHTTNLPAQSSSKRSRANITSNTDHKKTEPQCNCNSEMRHWNITVHHKKQVSTHNWKKRKTHVHQTTAGNMRGWKPIVRELTNGNVQYTSMETACTRKAETWSTSNHGTNTQAQQTQNERSKVHAQIETAGHDNRFSTQEFSPCLPLSQNRLHVKRIDRCVEHLFFNLNLNHLHHLSLHHLRGMKLAEANLVKWNWNWNQRFMLTLVGKTNFCKSQTATKKEINNAKTTHLLTACHRKTNLRIEETCVTTNKELNWNHVKKGHEINKPLKNHKNTSPDMLNVQMFHVKT